jgi:hypothetical protein
MDPTIVLSNDGAVDPMRGLARVDTTIANEKRYITSAGSTFSFDAELAEVSDDTFSETEVTITTRKAQGFIQASIETWMDQPDFSSEVVRLTASGNVGPVEAAICCYGEFDRLWDYKSAVITLGRIRRTPVRRRRSGCRKPH